MPTAVGRSSDHHRALGDDGFTWVRELFADQEHAFAFAGDVIARHAGSGHGVIGDFVLPPLGGERSRDFQTLHFDFGLPLDPRTPRDVAQFTALHVPAELEGVSALTRLVDLETLFGQRGWPDQRTAVERLTRYGETHGSFDPAEGYSEGSLARIVEALAGAAPRLPAVRHSPGFLCGMEFASIDAEAEFFASHGVSLAGTGREIPLAAGELLVFDNLRLAHGRRGSRQPGELRQRVFGHRAAPVDEQRTIRDDVLERMLQARASSNQTRW